MYRGHGMAQERDKLAGVKELKPNTLSQKKKKEKKKPWLYLLEIYVSNF